MRGESLEVKQKHVATSQQTYIHAVRSSRSYVPACGAAHAPSACRASPPAPRATPSIHPPVERRYLRPTIPSACRVSPSAPCCSIRPLSGTICALLPHSLVERRHLRLAAPSAIRPSNGALCALLSHPLCEFMLHGGVLLLGNGKLAAVLQGYLAAGHVAHKGGVDQVACMAANKEVAVALGD